MLWEILDSSQTYRSQIQVWIPRKNNSNSNPGRPYTSPAFLVGSLGGSAGGETKTSSCLSPERLADHHCLLSRNQEQLPRCG